MAGTSIATQVGNGLIGGLLLGTSTSALLGLGGQLTGISGFVHAGIWREGASAQPLTWRSLYLLALVSSGAAISALGFGQAAFGETHTRPWALALAGALVGFGTRMGNGCTSGHGLCGLPRLSPRSFLAVGSFMATGFATAMLVRSPALASVFHQPAALALRDVKPLAALSHALTGSASDASIRAVAAVAVGAAVLALPAVRLVRWLFKGSDAGGPGAAAAKPAAPSLAASAVTLACAAAFGGGLALAGMTRPDTVQAFLDPLGGGKGIGAWDLTLMGVMGGGVAVNALSFWWASRHPHPPPVPLEAPAAACPAPSAGSATSTHAPLSKAVHIGRVPANSRIDTPLLLGSALFGVGWGLAGICPGPGLVAAGGLQPGALIMLPFMVLGMGAYSLVEGSGLMGSAAASAAGSKPSNGLSVSIARQQQEQEPQSYQLGVFSPVPGSDSETPAADTPGVSSSTETPSGSSLRERRTSPTAAPAAGRG